MWMNLKNTTQSKKKKKKAKYIEIYIVGLYLHETLREDKHNPYLQKSKQ